MKLSGNWLVEGVAGKASQAQGTPCVESLDRRNMKRKRNSKKARGHDGLEQ